MKKMYCVALLAGMLAYACGGQKQLVQKNQEDVEVIVPCSGPEYMPDAEHFRASAMGLSNSQEIASQKAMTAARAKLAAAIQTTVKTVTDNYASSYEMGRQEEAKGRFQTLTREVVNQTLNGVKVICQKMMKSPEGQYKAYVAIELGGIDVAKAMNNKISSDDKLRVDFEYEKFKKIFDEEMKNAAEQQ
ncbi:MAG: hypothetical protein ACLTSL_01360 [Odoribacter splanchnicus]